jgi:integrase
VGALLADHYGKWLAETGVCAVTVKHYLSALCTLTSWSVKGGYLKRDPLERYTPIKATPAVVPGYRLEEVAAMAKCCNRATLRGRRQLAMLLLVLDSGVRVSELCALTIGDLQLEKGTAVVRHGKGDKFRLFSYAAPTAESLRRYLLLDHHGGENSKDFLFPGEDGGRLSRFAASRVISRLAKRAGVSGDRLGCHRLRHPEPPGRRQPGLRAAIAGARGRLDNPALRPLPG